MDSHQVKRNPFYTFNEAAFKSFFKEILYQIGRGLPPVIKQRTNRLTPVPLDSLPDEDDAKILHERIYTGRLTEEHTFGYDPLCENEIFYSQREAECFHCFDAECVHFRVRYFEDAILYFIDLTVNLAEQLE